MKTVILTGFLWYNCTNLKLGGISLEQKKLVWNPFKKEYWRKDNLIPPEKRESIRRDVEKMKADIKDSKRQADEMFGKGSEPGPEAVESRPSSTAEVEPKKKRTGWRLTWTIGVPLILTILFGIFGLVVGIVVFIIGIVGIMRK